MGKRSQRYSMIVEDACEGAEHRGRRRIPRLRRPDYLLAQL